MDTNQEPNQGQRAGHYVAGFHNTYHGVNAFPAGAGDAHSIRYAACVPGASLAGVEAGTVRTTASATGGASAPHADVSVFGRQFNGVGGGASIAAPIGGVGASIAAPIGGGGAGGGLPSPPAQPAPPGVFVFATTYGAGVPPLPPPAAAGTAAQ